MTAYFCQKVLMPEGPGFVLNSCEMVSVASDYASGAGHTVEKKWGMLPTDMDALRQYINDRIRFREEDFQLLMEIATPVAFVPKNLLIQAGRKVQYLYFLEEGLVKGYRNQEGKIVIEHLMQGGGFLTSMESFFQASASPESFEAITACRALQLTREAVEQLRSASEKWNELVEMVMSESLQCKMDRLKDFQTLTAKERYVKFLEQQPGVALGVSVGDLASYLGIAPPSLSRIRRQVIS
ncbi:MAG: Crp/Fnr family transcriptional regulator [Bacteroidota bacterium]